MTKFTKEQQLAIDLKHTNILVSAGAGSGKTAVLTERVLRKIKEGTSISRLKSEFEKLLLKTNFKKPYKT